MIGPAYATDYNDGGTHTISGPDADVVITNGTTVNIVPGASITPALQYDPFGGNAVDVSNGSLNVTGGSMTGGSSKFGGSGLSAYGGHFNISGGTFQGGSGAGNVPPIGSGRDVAGAGAFFGSWNSLSISGGNFSGGQGWAPNGTFGGDGVHINSGFPNIASISGGTFTGGSPDGFGLHVTGMATVNISGTFNGTAAFMDNSIGNLTGGHGNILSFNNALLNVTEGHFGGYLNLHDSSVASVSGGEVVSIQSYGGAIANVSGGQLSGTSVLNDNSVVNLTGGILAGAPEDFVMYGHSVVNVFGMGLSLDLHEETPGFPYWLLHGTLQSGTAIPEPTIILRFDNSVVNLYQIPEPTGFVMALSALVGLASARRACRRAGRRPGVQVPRCSTCCLGHVGDTRFEKTLPARA